MFTQISWTFLRLQLSVKFWGHFTIIFILIVQTAHGDLVTSQIFYFHWSIHTDTRTYMHAVFINIKDFFIFPFIMQVISGFQLPKKPVKTGGILDPFVKIQIFGVPSDTQEGRTKTIEDNGGHQRSKWNAFWALVPSSSQGHFCRQSVISAADDINGEYLAM